MAQVGLLCIPAAIACRFFVSEAGRWFAYGIGCFVYAMYSGFEFNPISVEPSPFSLKHLAFALGLGVGFVGSIFGTVGSIIAFLYAFTELAPEEKT